MIYKKFGYLTIPNFIYFKSPLFAATPQETVERKYAIFNHYTIENDKFQYIFQLCYYILQN